MSVTKPATPKETSPVDKVRFFINLFNSNCRKGVKVKVNVKAAYSYLPKRLGSTVLVIQTNTQDTTT